MVSCGVLQTDTILDDRNLSAYCESETPLAIPMLVVKLKVSCTEIAYATLFRHLSAEVWYASKDYSTIYIFDARRSRAAIFRTVRDE